MTRERDIRNAYSIKDSRENLIATVFENEEDTTSTSLTLHGRGAPLYGLRRNESLVHLMENFADTKAPSDPIDGQLWWNVGDQLYVYNELATGIGSPKWETIVPPFTGIGFNVVAGDGLTGGGFPTGSPAEVTIDLVAGTGIKTSDPVGEISHTFFTTVGSPQNETQLGTDEWLDPINVNVTLSTSSLNVGDDYFLLFLSGIGNETTADNFPDGTRLRVVEDTGSPVTLIPFSDINYRSVNAGSGILEPYCFFTSFTATGNDLRFQTRALTGSTEISYPRAFAISRTDLGSNALYTEDTTGITGVGYDFVDSTATITLDNGSDDYLVFWSVQWQVSPDDTSNEIALRFGNGSPQELLTVCTFRLFNGSDNSIVSQGGCTVFPATTNLGPAPVGSPHVPIGSPLLGPSITIAARQIFGFANDNLLRAAIGAIKLSAFDSHFSDFSPESGTFNGLTTLLHTKQKLIDTDSPVDWFIVGAMTVGFADSVGAGFSLSALADAGSPNTAFTAGSPTHQIGTMRRIRPYTTSLGDPSTVLFNEISSVPVGSLLTTQTMGVAPGNSGQAVNRSLAGFSWNLFDDGSAGSPEIVATQDSEIVHDDLSGFVANEHIDHTEVELIAGAGLRVSDGDGFIDTNVTFNVDTGGSPELNGLTASGDNLNVRTGKRGALRTSGSQTTYSSKSFTSQFRGVQSGTSAAVPTYGFRDSGSTYSSGVYRSGSNQLSFSTNGTQAFRIESNGVLRALSSTHETLVTIDDHIPNKKYVDDAVATAGIAVTSNTFVGVSSISGLDGDQTYLVQVYGATPTITRYCATLDSIRIRRGSTTPGVGTSVQNTPQQFMDLPDGDAVTAAGFIIPMNGETKINCQIQVFGPVCCGSQPVPRNALHMTAVQITSN